MRISRRYLLAFEIRILAVVLFRKEMTAATNDQTAVLRPTGKEILRNIFRTFISSFQ